MGRLLILACLLSIGIGFINKHLAYAAGPSVISFQGKVTNADGTNVTNGSYNFDFVMYDDVTLGSPSDGVHDKWHELTKSVTVTNGVFQTNLGSATALPDFNTNNALYLAIRFNADAAGYMTPRVQMASVPYALNADKLSGIAASTFVQLGATQSGNINIGTGTITAGASTLAGNTSLGTVGTGTASSTIHIADTSNGTGTQLVTIGSTANSANIVTIQGGGAASSIVLQAAASGGIDIGVNNVSGKTINIGSVGTTAQNSTLHFADSTAAVQTVTIGGTNTTSTTTIQAGTTGSINLSPAAGGNVVFSQGAGSNLQLTASAVPTIDQLAISNTGQGVTSAGVSGLQISYVGGNAAVEASAARIDLTPGGTSGGTWNGLRIVANGTGPVTGVTEYGVKLEGPTSPGAGTETGIYIGTGWDTGLDIQSGVINLAGYTSGGSPADPAAPAAGNLKIYAKKVAGRMMLKWIAPSGVDTSLQTSLAFNTIQLWTPSLSATGAGFGTVWPAGTGTFLNVVPTTGMGNQLRRARFTNVATTTNQILGVTASTAAQIPSFWRGNAAGQGGFFMQTRFTTELVPATSIRLFVGLSSMTTGASAADTVTGDTVGLSHITTDNITTMAFLTRDNTTTTRATFTVPTIASGNAYDFTMFAAPNNTTIYYRLVNLLTGSVLVDSSTSTTLPRNTIFMGPQVQMSNGTANVTVTTTAIAINKIYLESDN